MNVLLCIGHGPSLLIASICVLEPYPLLDAKPYSGYSLSYSYISLSLVTFAIMLAERYSVDENKEPHEVLSDIAIARACLKKGGEPDEEKAIKLLFDDFRSGKLGRVSLESPEQA